MKLHTSITTAVSAVSLTRLPKLVRVLLEPSRVRIQLLLHVRQFVAVGIARLVITTRRQMVQPLSSLGHISRQFGQVRNDRTHQRESSIGLFYSENLLRMITFSRHRSTLSTSNLG